ncbi:Nucleotidyl_cyclase [Hexamita inflata]|uniref:adenylate cyclase n=1 Tax=Hexamita inflata TaxID=28002 RepID=A0AA86UE97_9EUKA|nr:Nucleotidyl cyclase [Hexamita inflata]
MILSCVVMVAICMFVFSYTFTKSVRDSILVTFAFYLLPFYGTSFEKQMQTFVNVEKTAQQVNKMGHVILNAFKNALPSKLVPKIMNVEHLPCDVVQNVNFCYIYLPNKNIDSRFISKMNQLYSLLDVLCDAMGTQKIKSSSQCYMCCTGAHRYLESTLDFEDNYNNQYDASKILITYALMAKQLAQLFDLDCCCGITRGDVVMGMVSDSSSVINFDIYGDIVNTAARLARNNGTGVYLQIDDFKAKNINSPCHTEEPELLFSELLEEEIDMSSIRAGVLNTYPHYEFCQLQNVYYKGKGFVQTLEVLALDSLQHLTYKVLQKAYAQLIGDQYVPIKDDFVQDLQLEAANSLLEESDSHDIQCLCFSNPERSQYEFDLERRLGELKDVSTEIFESKCQTVIQTKNNSAEASVKLEISKKQKLSDTSSRNSFRSEKHLLKPSLQQFFDQAKQSNDMRVNLKKVKEYDEAISFEVKDNDAENSQFSTISDIVQNSSSSYIKQESNSAVLEIYQPEPKQQSNELLETKYDLISIHKFMHNFSKDYCELMCSKIDVFEIWVNAIDLKYSNYEFIVVLINSLIHNIIFTNQQLRIPLLSFRINPQRACKLLNYFYCAICLFFNIYQRQYLKILKKQLLIQKQKHNKQALHKLFWGHFHSINKIYQFVSTAIDVFKIFIFIKTIDNYSGFKQYADIYKIYLAMIAHMYSNQCVLSAKGHFCSNMTPIMSFNFWGKFFQVLIKAVVFSISMPIISICYIFMNILNTLLQYSKWKHIMIDSILKSDLHEQIQQGKKLLQNLLPKMSIDALLLTTVDKDSKDIVVLNDSAYSLKILSSIDELITNKQVPQFKRSLEEKYEEHQNYDLFRFCQLTHQFLNLPNNVSLGQTRPLIDFGEVAYLNLDVCSFTSFCSQHDTRQNMVFLTTLFKKFDERIKTAQNLIQVKISGDSYELMSLPTIIKKYSPTEDYQNKRFDTLREYESVIQLIAIGLGFITDCQTVLQAYPAWKDTIGLRVGISYGQVTGTLIGNKICRFDTYGDVPARAELAQSLANRNTVLVDTYAVNKLQNSVAAVNDYIVDYVTSETVRQRNVSYDSEHVNFDWIPCELGQLVTKIVK